MDYMTELAAAILDAVQGGHQEHQPETLSVLWQIINELVEASDDHEAWQAGIRAVQLEILTDMLYAHGDTLAAPAARSLGHYPKFIAELASRTVEILQAKKRTFRDRLLAFFRRSVHENFTNEAELADIVEEARRRTVKQPAETGTPMHLEGLMDLFIRDASLVNRVAELVDAAVPFNVMLARELHEIDASRKNRTTDDTSNEQSRFKAAERTARMTPSLRVKETQDTGHDEPHNVNVAGQPLD